MEFTDCPTCAEHGIGKDSFIDTTHIRPHFLEFCPCIVQEMTEPELIKKALDIFHSDLRPVTWDEFKFCSLLKTVGEKQLENLRLLARPPPVTSRYRHIAPEPLMSVRRNLFRDFQECEMDSESDFDMNSQSSNKSVDTTFIFSDEECCNGGDSIIKIPPDDLDGENIIVDNSNIEISPSFFNEVPERSNL